MASRREYPVYVFPHQVELLVKPQVSPEGATESPPESVILRYSLRRSLEMSNGRVYLVRGEPKTTEGATQGIHLGTPLRNSKPSET